MKLEKYKAKRNFKESPEPTGGKADNHKFRFVIQKHAASHLHYDFRLEMESVLKSWAVPKGPSTDPSVKRLAMMVEDHPYDYRNFEGIIPSGYGAGTVMIWDEGFYEPAKGEFKSKREMDKYFRQGLHAGKLHFKIHGKKLKGEYALVKTKGRAENGWLLFKVKDKFASEDDITVKDKSVISKKTLEQISKNGAEYSRNGKGSKAAKKIPVRQGKADKKILKKASEKKLKTKVKRVSAKNHTSVNELLEKAPKGKFPTGIRPMLATLVDKPFEDPDWIYEIKWDGYRALAFIKKGKVDLKSRNDKTFNEKFYPVTEALSSLPFDVVVDGEIVVSGKDGISNFGALQNWRSEADGELLFYIFDILWYEGKDLTGLSLSERREILENIINQDGILRLSESFSGPALEFFEAVKKLGLEGIIAKQKDSAYIVNKRSKEWLKIKANLRQEMVIGGYTRNDDTSKLFSALLLGVYEDGKLIYTGKVGTGFSDKLQKEMLKQFKPLIVKKAPFAQIPDVNKASRFRPDPPNATVFWIKPVLVCEVSFTEMTNDGIMRHPSFEGLRIDKPAKSVIREKASPLKKIPKVVENRSGKKIIRSSAKADRKTLLNPSEETQVKKVNGNELKFTNLSKIYWPQEKISKRDMINYYYQAAPFILPYLKDRPQSMLRHPDGIKGFSFFYKNIKGKGPDWLDTYKYHSEGDGEDKEYLIAKDEASLLYMASLGAIEMNPWHSRVQSEDFPDWCIIDLDPAKNTFDQVIEAALVTRDVLKSMGIEGYPKTSGSTGIHIYIPFGARYTYEQSKEFARIVATLIHRELPEFTTIERAVKNRKGKMYIDFLQNRPQATVSAPYSLRPKPGATVSMPLHWWEVKKGLKMKDFTIFNAIERMRSEGDLFKPVLGKGINLGKAIRTFEKSP